MTVQDVLPYLAGVVAFIVFIFARRDASRAEGSTLQAIRDRLDRINDTTQDTRDDVRDIKRTLDDHSTRLTRLEERVTDHGRRLDKAQI
jgi:chromosome segregation ATPase